MVPSKLLTRYCNECLSASFQASGLALQDAVNEVGSRLGADVSPGRYRGDQRHIGFDGLWRFPSGHSIVVEVKTTDAFSIDLETIAGYRTALVAEGKVTTEASSGLIIVGREDTGNLEAQIRGSPHAWDVRLISVDALLRLLALKEEVGDPTTVGRIHAILIPREFTRLDAIADILFSTAADLKEEEAVSQIESSDEREAKPAKPKFTPVAFHDACAVRIERYLGCTLVKRTRAAFSTPDKSIAVVCAVSKRHPNGDYWFAFHPHQQEFLESATTSFVAFGCGSEQCFL